MRGPVTISVLALFLTTFAHAEPIEFIEVKEPITYTASSGRSYVIPGPPEDAVDRVAYELMSPEMQAQFLKNRMKRLRRKIRASDRVLTPKAAVTASFRNIFAADDSDLVTTADMRRLGQAKLQAKIDALDASFWKNPEVVAKSNEIGFAPRAGVYAGLMTGRVGLFWSTGVGAHAKLNPKEGQVALEFFQDIDRATSVLPGTASIGGYVGALGSLGYRDPKAPLEIEEGTTFCTIGGTACLTSRTSRVGWTGGAGLALPIPNAYKEESWHVPLARFGLSYKFPFVQMKLLNPMKLANLYAKILWPKFKSDFGGAGTACRWAFAKISPRSSPSQGPSVKPAIESGEIPGPSLADR